MVSAPENSKLNVEQTKNANELKNLTGNENFNSSKVEFDFFCSLFFVFLMSCIKDAEAWFTLEHKHKHKVKTKGKTKE